jgi:transposase
VLSYEVLILRVNKATTVKINITEAVENARMLLEKEKKVSPAFRAMFEMLLMIISMLADRLGLNSKNSSKPPSTDPNRRKKNKGSNNRKPGGQPGRIGKNLEPFENPDRIIPLKLDRRHLPKGNYQEAGFETRQVVDIEISRMVTEYQAQVLLDSEGRRYVAAFPEGVTRPVQYGQSIKSHAVYLSQYQLIPYERVADYFINEAHIPVSVGSL